MCIRDSFYTTFDAVRDKHFDGLIITGAPVERLEFEEVDYLSLIHISSALFTMTPVTEPSSSVTNWQAGVS